MRTKKPDTPITKGLALILAREILGPTATVQSPHAILVPGGAGPGVAIYASDWDHALERARKQPHAAAWEKFKDDRSLTLINAVKSLRETARALLNSKGVNLLARHEHRFVRNSLRGLA